ncbi:DUF4384 domain-containing protein [Deinococcus misasensis]|uniref:DUF4384 domain-containing protein n=1 Tax=Deinococcus misasensis TaxID=392413 RepID=UPI00055136FA|nr:DUF4384 domain-containing protein [Deinococcus misasensis]
MKRYTVALAASLLGFALSAPQISPQRIIVNPVPTELSVDVWLDKSGNSPAYTPGEKVTIYTRVNQDAYVYLFNVDPDGRVDLILPNKYASGGNFLKANTTKMFPDRNDPFEYEISAPYGVNKVLALASKTQLNLNDIARFQSGQSEGFAQITVEGQNQLAQKLSIIVKPIPQDKWITDTAYYNVVSGVVAPPVQQFRDVTASSYPGARVSVQSQKEDRLVLEFTTSDSTQQVWGFYQRDLESQGYRLVSLNQKNRDYEARFTRKAGRDDDTLTVKLKFKNKGRYSLELRW